MAILSACYRFVADHSHHRAIPWRSVRRELRQVCDLIFVVELEMSASTATEVHVGDSADKGYALMVTQAGHAEVRREMAYREKWRFIESRDPVPSSLREVSDAQFHIQQHKLDEEGDVQDFHYVGHSRRDGGAASTAYGQAFRKSWEAAEADDSLGKKRHRLCGPPLLPDSYQNTL